MSTLSVTTINTANGTTDLIMTSGNTAGGKVVVSSGGGVFLQGNSGANAIVIATNNAVTFSNSTIHTGVASFTDITASGTVAMASSFKRNRIINGNMLIWQRGTSGFTTSGYCVDRWTINYAGTFTSAAQSTDVPAGFKYSLTMTNTATSGNWAGIFQSIESINCTDLVGQSITISFWAKQSAGAGANSMIAALEYPSAADNYTSTSFVTGSTVAFTGTASWARYSYTIANLPSGVANGLRLRITTNGANTFTTLITGVQLEVGNIATPYEMQIYSDQLAQCQRYYVDSNPGSATAAYTNIQYSPGGAGWPIGTISLPVTMRTAPTISTRNVTLTNASGLVIGSVFPNYFYGSVTVGGAGSYVVSLNYTTSAEL